MKLPELNKQTSATVELAPQLAQDGTPLAVVIIKQDFIIARGVAVRSPGAWVRLIDEPWDPKAPEKSSVRRWTRAPWWSNPVRRLRIHPSPSGARAPMRRRDPLIGKRSTGRRWPSERGRGTGAGGRWTRSSPARARALTGQGRLLEWIFGDVTNESDRATEFQLAFPRAVAPGGLDDGKRGYRPGGGGGAAGGLPAAALRRPRCRDDAPPRW